jgi:hypothetical protein
VRQAQQTLVLSAVVLLGGAFLVTKALPAQVMVNSSSSYAQLWLMVMAALAVLDAIVLGGTFVRFQRSRLILH